MSWRRILFAVATPGGVPPAIMAKVAQLAHGADAELELFYCVFDAQLTRPRRFGSRGIEEDIQYLVEQHRQQLEAVAAPLRAQGARVRTTVRWDHPVYEGIVRQVLRRRPALLVVQSSRSSRVGRLVLTHTDYRLIENCPVPVLVIKGEQSYAKPRIVAAVDPLHAHDKPAALDIAILDAARAVSAALQGRLHLYHACEPWRDSVRQSAGLRRVARAVQAEAHASHCQRAESRVAALARDYRVPSDRAHVEQGRVATALPRFVHNLDATITVLGAVARTGLDRLRLGMTAERVLDALDGDVLIAKAPGFRSPVSRHSVHHAPRRGQQRVRYVW